MKPARGEMIEPGKLEIRVNCAGCLALLFILAILIGAPILAALLSSWEQGFPK